MSRLGAAYVEISATLVKFDQGLKLAKSNTNKFLKDISKGMEALNFMPIIKNIGMIGWQFAQITAPITATGAALFMLAKKTANVGEELLKMHQKTGVGVAELYSLKKALELDDLALGDLSIALKTLSYNLVESKTKAGEARDIFKALDIDTSKPLLETFLTLAKRLSGFENSENKMALATKLLGKSGQNLIPTLNELGENGLKVAKVFNEESARAADQFNDNITILKQNISELTYHFGNKLIPELNNFFAVVKAGGKDEFVSQWLEKLGKDLDALEAIKGKGITNIKDVPFLFEGKPFTLQKEVPIIIDSKQLKKDEDEAKRTAHAIAEAYKDMYDSLKFDTGKYYDYRKSSLEKQRDEEIKTTGDLQLAWEAYHARLAELDEQRLERSNRIMDGVELFFRTEQRSGITVANSVKEALESAKNSGINNIASLMKGIETGSLKGRNAWRAMAQSMVGSFLDAANQMIAQWLFMKAIGMIAGMFGNLGSGAGGFGTVAGGSGASAGQFGGMGSGSYIPGYSGGVGGGFSAKASGSIIVNQNITVPITAADSQDVDRMLRRGGHRAITDIMGEAVERSVGYAKRIRGQRVG